MANDFLKLFCAFATAEANNLLTIKKDYMTANNIEIEITARPRPYLFLFGYELESDCPPKTIKLFKSGIEIKLKFDNFSGVGVSIYYLEYYFIFSKSNRIYE